jgi:hypothetical protein
MKSLHKARQRLPLNLNFQSSYVLKQQGEEKEEKKQSDLEKKKSTKKHTVKVSPSFFYPHNS